MCASHGSAPQSNQIPPFPQKPGRAPLQSLLTRKKGGPASTMIVVQSAGELTIAYEALRSQATGRLPTVTPRGLALFLMAGFPEWMTAWSPLAPAVAKTTAAPPRREPPVVTGNEVVHLLTEMALGCQRRSMA